MSKLTTGIIISGAATAMIFAIFSKNISNWIPLLLSRPVEVISENPFIAALFGVAIGTSYFGVSQWLRWELIRKLLEYRNWMYDHKSWKTKAWGIMLKLLMPKENLLNSVHDYLPKYPLPKLKDTCKRTLEMVKPLLSGEDFDLVVKAIKDFQHNEGPELQKFLEKRYETEENWVAELWDKYVYLAGRSPIPVHSNFSCNGPIDFNYGSLKQSSQAANIIHYFLEFQEKIVNRQMSHMMIQNVIPICCDRYKYILSTTRIPGEEIDELKKFPNAKHVVIFRKKFMYKLQVYAPDANGKDTLLTPREIQSQIEKLMADADQLEQSSLEPVINPAVFTTAPRTRWAQIRKRMQKDPLSAESLEDVESAAFCLALDEDRPQNRSEEFYLFLTGNGFNKWFDKSLNFVVAANNALGFNTEHTTAEATLGGRLFEYALYHSKYDAAANPVDGTRRKHKTVPQPQLLKWNLKEFKEDIADIRAAWDKLANDVDTCVYFVNKGKSFMKKLRVSPDGYMQMALQLAFYRLHKDIPKTYETATTRLFKLGRTETIRPVSEHSVAFVKEFDDPRVPAADKIHHLKEGIKYQTKYKFDAMNGEVVDRHLLGLYIAGKLTGVVPKLFTLRPFCEPDRLSTSQSPLRYDPVITKLTPHVPVGGGFGPQHPEGYGVAYFVDEHHVSALITSFKSCPATGSDKFAQALQNAVDDVKILLETSSTKSKQSNGVKADGVGDVASN